MAPHRLTGRGSSVRIAFVNPGRRRPPREQTRGEFLAPYPGSMSRAQGNSLDPWIRQARKRRRSGPPWAQVTIPLPQLPCGTSRPGSRRSACGTAARGVARQLTTHFTSARSGVPPPVVCDVGGGTRVTTGSREIQILIILIFVLPDLRMSVHEARPAAADRARLA